MESSRRTAAGHEVPRPPSDPARTGDEPRAQIAKKPNKQRICWVFDSGRLAPNWAEMTPLEHVRLAVPPAVQQPCSLRAWSLIVREVAFIASSHANAEIIAAVWVSPRFRSSRRSRNWGSSVMPSVETVQTAVPASQPPLITHLAS